MHARTGSPPDRCRSSEDSANPADGVPFLPMPSCSPPRERPRWPPATPTPSFGSASSRTCPVKEVCHGPTQTTSLPAGSANTLEPVRGPPPHRSARGAATLADHRPQRRGAGGGTAPGDALCRRAADGHRVCYDGADGFGCEAGAGAVGLPEFGIGCR